jgi:hypothetical protein
MSPYLKTLLQKLSGLLTTQSNWRKKNFTVSTPLTSCTNTTQATFCNGCPKAASHSCGLIQKPGDVFLSPITYHQMLLDVLQSNLSHPPKVLANLPERRVDEIIERIRQDIVMFTFLD